MASYAASGVSNKIQLLTEVTYGGGTGAEAVFGVTKKFSWNIDTSTTQSFGLESAGPQATVNIDGVMAISGTHEWEVTSGRELKAILGSEASGSGTGASPWALAVSNTLPSYCVKVIDESGDADDYMLISGLKYSKFSISAQNGNTVVITGTWTARKVADTTTFTPTVSTVEPLIAEDCYFVYNSTTAVELESISLDIDRKCVPKRFLEAVGTGDRRLISKIIEGPLTVTGSGSITGQRAYLNAIMGGTSQTDTRADVTASITLKRGVIIDTISLTGVKLNTLGMDFDKTSEVSLAAFTLLARGISATISNTA